MAPECDAPTPIDHFIGGRSCAPNSGERIDDIDAATGRVIGRIARGDALDVLAAVTAAKAALPGWSRTPAPDRARLLERIADAIEADLEGFAQLESLDTGKPIALAREIDIPRAVANFRFFASAIRQEVLGCHPMANALNYTQRRPLGVVGLITPWNLPLYLLTWKTAPALAMGNTIVAKPSELTPQTAVRLAQLMSDVGLPKGVFNVVHGYGPEVGQPLVEHPHVSGVSFTGGTTTGATVAASTARRFKKLSLELGGKNATIVFADADLEAAAEGAVRAGFANQGQVCLCGSRLLVQRPVYDAFVERVRQRVDALKVGPPQDDSTQVGALISAAHRDKVEGYVALAKEEGGELLSGGVRPTMEPPYNEGAFLRPTLIGGLHPTCRASTEEIFGPVVTVHPFDTADEAVAIANDVRYGLAASVWTNDLKRAHRVSEALDVGMVWVNTWLLRDLRVPFGGVKDSGVGREGGVHSMEFFSESKNICIHLGESQ